MPHITCKVAWSQTIFASAGVLPPLLREDLRKLVMVPAEAEVELGDMAVEPFDKANTHKVQSLDLW